MTQPSNKVRQKLAARHAKNCFFNGALFHLSVLEIKMVPKAASEFYKNVGTYIHTRKGLDQFYRSQVYKQHLQ